MRQVLFAAVLIVGRNDEDGQSFDPIGLHKTDSASDWLLINGLISILSDKANELKVSITLTSGNGSALQVKISFSAQFSAMTFEDSICLIFLSTHVKNTFIDNCEYIFTTFS